MKCLIDSVVFDRKYTTKFGDRWKFKISYYGENEKLMYGYYSASKETQTKFVPGQEAEFDISSRDTPMGQETVIKPLYEPKNTGFARKIKEERSKYSGFSSSYIKDLLIAGIIKPEIDEETKFQNEEVMLTWRKYSYEIFKHMVKLDTKNDGQ